MKSNFLKYLALALVLLTLAAVGACAKPALSVGDTFVLGPATVEVTKLYESMASPVLGKSPQSGMKFVLVELEITQLQSGVEFDSALIFLEFSSGKQYGPPKVYGESESYYGGGHFEADSQKITYPGEGEYHGGDESNLFFEVDQSESLDTLIKLGYH